MKRQRHQRPRPPAHVLALRPYKPGKPIEEVERELGLTDTIKVASNENALGPSPAAVEAISAALRGVHRYPDGSAFLLVGRLAEKLGVDRRRIVLGNGSNEIIELLVRMLAGPGDEVAMSADAFLVYDLVTRAVAATPVAVPARDFHHDLDAMTDACSERTKIVFVATPNNPTGTIVRKAEWQRFLRAVPASALVVVDQAYYEYVDDPDYADAFDDLDGERDVVVIRTFSKIYGLAGLRIGYGIGPREIMDALARLRQPFNVNSLAQTAALAAIDDDDHVERSRTLASESRGRYEAGLARLGLAFVPSQANFVLVEVGHGAEVTRELLARGVIVRPMDAYGLPRHVRITFATREEDERCLQALSAVLGAGAA